MTDNPTDPYTLSPNDVAASLVELSAAYNTAKGEPAVHELDAAAAGARLAEMTKAYQESIKPKNTAADATIVGEQPPRNQFETTTWPQTTVRNKLDVLDHLRALEIPEKGLEQILAGKGPYTEADVAWAKHQRDVVFHDPDVRARILSGDREAVRHVVGVNQILIVGAAK